MADINKTAANKRLYASWTFSIGPSALEFQINFINLALANRVYSGQASSSNTDYPTSVKPRTLAAIFNMKHILRLFSPLFFIALVMNTMGRVQNSQEILEWSSTRINNKLPLLCKKKDLLNLLGKPDKILDPQSLDICTSYFENNFSYLVWGQSQFESTESQAVISSIDIEAGKLKLVSPKITLDNSVTLEKIKRLFPKSSKMAQELVIDNKGKVLSIKLAASSKNSDDGWLLFFKAGKLVRVDYWIAC